jgi:hypothetical protein
MKTRFIEEAAPRLARHGLTVVACFDSTDSADTLVYLVQAASEDALKQGWAAFGANEGWLKIKRESEVDGPLLATQSSLTLSPATARTADLFQGLGA